MRGMTRFRSFDNGTSERVVELQNLYGPPLSPYQASLDYFARRRGGECNVFVCYAFWSNMLFFCLIGGDRRPIKVKFGAVEYTRTHALMTNLAMIANLTKF